MPLKILLTLTIGLLLVGGGCAGPSADEIAQAQRYLEYNTVLYSTSTGYQSWTWTNTSSATSSIEISNVSPTGTYEADASILADGGKIIVNWTCLSQATLFLFKNRVEIKNCRNHEIYFFDEATREFFDENALKKIREFIPNFSL